MVYYHSLPHSFRYSVIRCPPSLSKEELYKKSKLPHTLIVNPIYWQAYMGLLS